MAILCLSTSLENFKERVSRVIIAYRRDGSPVYVKDIKAQGAVTLLMKDAIMPNLVQTLENTPALILSLIHIYIEIKLMNKSRNLLMSTLKKQRMMLNLRKCILLMI